MADLNSLKVKVAEMSQTALSMWQITHQAFMEHDIDLFPGIFEKEDKLNNMQKELVDEFIKLGRSLEMQDKVDLIGIYVDIVGDLELIGDYCKDILERVETKIEERLLFSEDSVKEYNELYTKTEEALDEVTRALKKDRPDLVKEILNNQGHIDTLVDQYRLNHNHRLMSGVCTPLGCNMFLNMLDFT
ncbi:MAG: PhoU domain-containing protein, partial [Candidatus Omnitrophota bacterium]